MFLRNFVAYSDVNRYFLKNVFFFAKKHTSKKMFFLENEFNPILNISAAILFIVEFSCSDGSNREREEQPFRYHEGVASVNFTMQRIRNKKEQSQWIE